MSMLCGNVQERSKAPDEHLLRLGVTILERIHEAGLVSGEPGGHPRPEMGLRDASSGSDGASIVDWIRCVHAWRVKGLGVRARCLG